MKDMRSEYVVLVTKSHGKKSGNRWRTKLPCKVKVKVKFTLEQAMKAQRGSRVMALLFL
jgi:hypothetical protein